MKQLTSILSITGSDNTGGSGIQADIRTITTLGGYALTAITSITIQDASGIQRILDLPTDLVVAQTSAIIAESHPKAVKVGMVRNVDAINLIGREIVGCKNIILAPGVLSSQGEALMSPEAIEAWKRFLIPQASLLLIRCSEAETMLGIRIEKDEDMVEAAKRFVAMGAQYVMLRGAHIYDDMLTALLYGPEDAARSKSESTYVTKDNIRYEAKFFSSHNLAGWQKHGVGGALSSAIATRLAKGDSMNDAITNAHSYIHSQLVYSVSSNTQNLRPADLYNQYMSLIAANYRTMHEVRYYADKLAITTRYLSQVTSKVVGKTPKELLADYIVNETCILLSTTRLSIQQISNELGFSSQSLFCKYFSRVKGCSPSEWRAKN